MFLPIMVQRKLFWITLAFILILTPCIVAASDARTIATSHFVFYFHEKEHGIAASLAAQAERIRGEIVEDLGLDFDEVTTVYLAHSLKEYAEIQPRGWVPTWSAAVAYPSLNLIIMKSPRVMKGGHMDLDKVFKHELTHIAVGRAFRGREEVPRWLDEGLAMYESREWSFSRVSSMTKAVLTDSLIPLSEITSSFPREVARAELAYSQSFYLISFLVSKFGKEDFHRFIREYTRGGDLKGILLKVYGIGWDDFEEEWKGYLRLRFSWIPILTSTTTLWFLITLVFILGYARKKRAQRMLYEQWEQEDDDLLAR
jgi:predicted metallopeptidase